MEYSCSSILKWLSELGIGNGDLLNFQFEDVSLWGKHDSNSFLFILFISSVIYDLLFSVESVGLL